MKTVPTTAEPGSPFNFAQHLMERNSARPDKIAFIDDQGALSYGALAPPQRHVQRLTQP
jgi:benzoate-CoA ligase